MIRGVDLRGEPLFYKTQAELEADHEKFRIKLEEDRRKRFEKDRKKLDRQFGSLPEVFQRRLSWFRASTPGWRAQHEGYEMTCCVDAVKIATVMKTPAGVRRFQKMSSKKQHELIPDLDTGHSGNTFGMAVRLAFLYLSEPLLVIAEHAAISPLLGCDGCGCVHPRPQDVMDTIAPGER